MDHDRATLRMLLGMGGDVYTPALLESVLARLHTDDPCRREIRLILEEARHRSESASAAVLEAHLRRMIDLARQSGAQPVLLSYPFPSDTNMVARRVAGELDAGWIDLEAEIAGFLKTGRREDLFVADGHLNDRGYAIIARLVADDVARRSGK